MLVFEMATPPPSLNKRREEDDRHLTVTYVPHRSPGSVGCLSSRNTLPYVHRQHVLAGNIQKGRVSCFVRSQGFGSAETGSRKVFKPLQHVGSRSRGLSGISLFLRLSAVGESD